MIYKISVPTISLFTWAEI